MASMDKSGARSYTSGTRTQSVHVVLARCPDSGDVSVEAIYTSDAKASEHLARAAHSSGGFRYIERWRVR